MNVEVTAASSCRRGGSVLSLNALPMHPDATRDWQCVDTVALADCGSTCLRNCATVPQWHWHCYVCTHSLAVTVRILNDRSHELCRQSRPDRRTPTSWANTVSTHNTAPQRKRVCLKTGSCCLHHACFWQPFSELPMLTTHCQCGAQQVDKIQHTLLIISGGTHSQTLNTHAQCVAHTL